MEKISLTINNVKVTGVKGQTILEIATENNIEIPTLCHDERVETFGACGICAVEVENSPKLLRACAITAADNMVIFTESERVLQNRKTVLELLLSDHEGDCLPPCTLACPAETNCQGYANLIANGEYDKAVELIMEKIPLPASIGRVCPHPCEEACRRQLVEEPISLAALKRFAGDYNISRNAQIAPTNGKSVAIIGGGPGGLSAAYFLRQKNYNVTVYEAESHMGGMLRYGIPEYRLPNSLLQKEIDVIQSTGVNFKNNVRIGEDITLDELRKNNDAVIVAAGAWSDSKLRCSGEELDGVLGGIKFLYDAANGKIKEDAFKGLKVAVVGGGNTAMDVCRTAVRRGADKVFNIYRRTKNEMPAEEIEIIEAEEEGVIFKNLTNPLEIVGNDNKVNAVRLQIMELGEPDSSGRRAPVAVEGKEERLDVDVVIAAIGQKLNPKGFEELELTKWGTIIADEKTFLTNLDGVFAIGDATNNGADIAVSAIGEALKVSKAVDRYLSGLEFESNGNPKPCLAKTEKTAADLKDREKQPRVKTPCRSAETRRNDKLEINSTFTEEQAKSEASRCLACGCLDYFECKLIKYANEFNATVDKYSTALHKRGDDSRCEIPNITRTPEKCVLCGLCVRLCEEEVGAGILGFVGRGFDTVVMPAAVSAAQLEKCRDCGKCAEVCPTGGMHG